VSRGSQEERNWEKSLLCGWRQGGEPSRALQYERQASFMFVVVSFPMALPPTTTALEDDANWAVERATALPEFWALVAERGR
jgi:hypothetical protein